MDAAQSTNNNQTIEAEITIEPTAADEDETFDYDIDNTPAQAGFFKPKITGSLDFGDPGQDFDVVYPSTSRPLEIADSDKDIRLKYIHYKTYKTKDVIFTTTDIYYLAGIKFEFTNGL